MTTTTTTSHDSSCMTPQRASASLSHRHVDANLDLLATSQAAGELIELCVAELLGSTRLPEPVASHPSLVAFSTREKLGVGLAALDIFLQANVTGPVVPAHKLDLVQSRFVKAWTSQSTTEENKSATLSKMQRCSLVRLEVDGVSPYAYIPHLELFSLASFVFRSALHVDSEEVTAASTLESEGRKYSLPWLRLRIHTWHYKLLTQPTLGPGSNFAKSSQWAEVPSLATTLLGDMESLRAEVVGNEVWSESDAWDREATASFLIEAANIYILLGRQEKAKEALVDAAQVTGFKYALSGALGKRTKFQERNISQLVVLALSSSTGQNSEVSQTANAEDNADAAKPDALQLNDDTLLEEIQFAKEEVIDEGANRQTLPQSLAELSPDRQPQLAPLDQVILLTEATLKDAFLPVDTLTSEEILPYAVRVLTDRSTNWQIYTQALLVRSRIEIHRSRTVERGVLQLQAVADQVLSDTSGQLQPANESHCSEGTEAATPVIQVTTADQEKTAASVKAQVPTSFLPAPKATESAPAHIRLRYIDALSTPPRWHLESELAYAWAGVGSLTSALEIFKRLRLWAEVALCLASAAASEDEDGRGSGGEEKARTIIRWRLFHRTGQDDSSSLDPDDEDVEHVMRLKPSTFEGSERRPPPPNAPRLWCVLGDIENDPQHYRRAWEISKQRYARAQKSLGEHFLAEKDLVKAQEAYRLATSVNRLSPELWSRLGDISLRLGQFEEAAEAYSRSIGCATDTAGGEDARTWSNLGSALWSLYCEVTADEKDGRPTPSLADRDAGPEGSGGDDDGPAPEKANQSHDPAALLSRSLAAYKKGASIAHDNWRIWDNVLTLAARLQPPPVPDMILALTHVLRIRKSEDAIDTALVTALLQDVVLSKDKPSDATSAGIYEPPLGSQQRLATRLIEEEIVPLITQRAELWSIVSRLRVWRRDYAGAIDACERAWRATAGGGGGGGGGGLLPGQVESDSADWTVNQEAWHQVVKRTDELVSMLENWGPDVESIGARWKGKARSAIRTVMGRGKESWEGSEGWMALERLMEGLRAAN